MVRAGRRIQIPLENGENLNLQVTDFYSSEGNLEIVAYLDFVDGKTPVHRNNSISVSGWGSPGPAINPALSIYMASSPQRFLLPENRDGSLGIWLNECCDCSGPLEARYTPKYEYFLS
jgi:hypothetical protein